MNKTTTIIALLALSLLTATAQKREIILGGESCFSEQVFQADNSAFEALVRHISETGSDVVTMIQVENGPYLFFL